MEVSNAQHHQRMGSKLEDGSSLQQQDQKRLRPNPEQFLRCPRCDSTNTKFCYYNNYSLSQPRYFCKGCRRYWTQGGSLRNVPVGGGCRKNKRSSSSSSCSSSSSTKKSPNLDPETTTNPLQLLPALPLPPLSYDPNELSLAFASLHSQQQPIMDHDQDNNNNNSSSTFLVPSLNPDNPGAGFLDILRGGLNADSSSSNSNSCGLYYGFGGGVGEVECGGVMMLPFDGGLMNSTEAVTTTTTATTAAAAGATATSTGQASTCGKAMMDGADQQLDSKLMVQQGMLSQWPVGGGGDHAAATASLAVDPVLRDYWNGVGSSWHGIINSSLM